VLVGDEEDVFHAGKIVFDRGYYIQSVAIPAVPYRAAVLRIQVNSNHSPEAIDGLLEAMAVVRRKVAVPLASTQRKSDIIPIGEAGWVRMSA
jgi:hypothetical protein